jgi:hypothetical protein
VAKVLDRPSYWSIFVPSCLFTGGEILKWFRKIVSKSLGKNPILHPPVNSRSMSRIWELFEFDLFENMIMWIIALNAIPPLEFVE